MSDYMIRFLNSIGVENVESFDMDFICLKKQPNGIWKMDIKKNSYWSFDQLNEFKTKLINIDYPYELSFTYGSTITAEIIFKLLLDWYKNIYHVSYNTDHIKIKDGYLVVKYLNETIKKDQGRVIRDFKEFLEFICYPCLIKEVVKDDVFLLFFQ